MYSRASTTKNAFKIFAYFDNVSSGSILRHKLLQGNAKCVNILAKGMSSVDSQEIKNFSGWKNIWWDEKGGMKTLHSYNPIRMELIRNSLANIGFVSQNPALSLEKLKIADVGCGGGILSECLARAGARVTGIDAATDLINAAKEHVKLDPNIADRVDYLCTNIEEFAPNNAESYDVVVSSEVVEHVADPELFLKKCVKILKPGGSIFLTTMNKTFTSWLAGIVIAEYIAGIVPRGTHDWKKFIAPHEIQRILDQCGCKTKLIHGLQYNPLSIQWSWSSCTAISYALHAVKQGNTNP